MRAFMAMPQIKRPGFQGEMCQVQRPFFISLFRSKVALSWFGARGENMSNKHKAKSKKYL